MERLFWSVPLSLAISTISSVLIGWFLSLLAVQIFLLASVLLFTATIARERIQVSRSGGKFPMGWKPFGGIAVALAMFWIALVVLSLVDFESKHRLFMSLTVYDHAARTNWTESIIRTGIPPANPLYFFKQSASMRYYYFWLVDCAAVTKISHLPARTVLIAGCVWAGFSLAALTGILLKHFLLVGARLRQQFLIAMSLFCVAGLTICLEFWNMFFFHIPPPGDRWALVQIVDWLSYFLFYPHHVISMVCCMLAFLFAAMAQWDSPRERALTVVLIAAALASAFGLSVYVAFAFFLVMVVWAIWQTAIERSYRPTLFLIAGGAGAIVLLLPYLWQLTQSVSKVGGGSIFAFFVRETLPADWLLSLQIFKNLAASHPLVARNIANLIMLVPGYVVELGLPVIVLLICLVPAWRSRTPLTAPQRSLVLIAATTLPIMSLIRSGVLTVNDFGLHSALFLQFPLLLLASELLVGWRLRRELTEPAQIAGLPGQSPMWLRSLATLAMAIGVFSATYKAIDLRFFVPFYGDYVKGNLSPHMHDLSHKAYISNLGYAHLDSSIPRDAIVQFNPVTPNPWWTSPDLFGINRQTAAAYNQLWCGSELGGDPSGCPAMAADIDAVYKGATPQQTRAVCRQYGIHYLVANIYDPAWQDKQSWVWTLSSVASDPEFRVLDCH